MIFTRNFFKGLHIVIEHLHKKIDHIPSLTIISPTKDNEEFSNVLLHGFLDNLADHAKSSDLDARSIIPSLLPY
jgi:glucose-6-phosphate isomerase